MNRQQLQDCAHELRMLPRPLELPDDRLRANILAFLAEMFENSA
jgi:hypothetical protein